MRTIHVVVKAAFVLVVAVVLESCATVFTSRSSVFAVSGIFPEKRNNGYVFKIEASRQLGKVEAWIGQDNWLYMSIPDTSINTVQLKDLTDCPVVSKMQLFRYSGSVQVTLLLNAKFDHVGVLSYPGERNVYVVLYDFREAN
jgi:hypothetical protein